VDHSETDINQLKQTLSKCLGIFIERDDGNPHFCRCKLAFATWKAQNRIHHNKPIERNTLCDLIIFATILLTEDKQN